MKDRPTPYCMWLPNSQVWLDTLNPDYTNVMVEDIVWPLSAIVRFTGQLPIDTPKWRASVLTHSALCYDIAEGLGITDEKLLRTIFFHDAQEAFIQDVSGPVKAAMRKLANPWGTAVLHSIGTEEQEAAVGELFLSHYDAIEERHEVALAKRFDLIMPKPEIVKRIDRLAFAFEVREHFGEERLKLREVEEDPDEVPPIALRRRHYYDDVMIGLRLAKVLVGEDRWVGIP